MSRARPAAAARGCCTAFETVSCFCACSFFAAAEDSAGAVSSSRSRRSDRGDGSGGRGKFAWAVCVSPGFADEAPAAVCAAPLCGASATGAIFCALKVSRGGACCNANHNPAADARPAAGMSQRHGAGPLQIRVHHAAFRTAGLSAGDDAAARLPNFATSASLSSSSLATRTAMIFWQRLQSAKWLSQRAVSSSARPRSA